MSEATTPAITSLFRKNLPPPVDTSVRPLKYTFNSGHNDLDLMPVDALAAAAATVIKREGAHLAKYNLGTGPLGHEGLRGLVQGRLEQRGFSGAIENVLITSGSGQGIDLVNELLLEPGDVVFVEEFSYQGAIRRIAKHGVQLVPIAMDDDGIKVDDLERAIAELAAQGSKAKFLYTIPTIQNPTGSILSEPRRRAIAALAQTHNFVIFEDECYADLIWSGEAPPSFMVYAPAHTIHIGSFSKNLAPALRLGYVVAEQAVLQQLVAMKSDGGTSALAQMIAFEFCEQHFDSHIQALIKTMSRKCDIMIEAIQAEFGVSADIQRPRGGIYVWFKLPEGVDTRDFVKPAAALGVAFNPGPDWAVVPDSAKNWMRLCFALPTEAEIRDGVRVLADVVYAVTGLPERSANRDRSKP